HAYGACPLATARQSRRPTGDASRQTAAPPTAWPQVETARQVGRPPSARSPAAVELGFANAACLRSETATRSRVLASTSRCHFEQEHSDTRARSRQATATTTNRRCGVRVHGV